MFIYAIVIVALVRFTIAWNGEIGYFADGCKAERGSGKLGVAVVIQKMSQCCSNGVLNFS